MLVLVLVLVHRPQVEKMIYSFVNKIAHQINWLHICNRNKIFAFFSRTFASVHSDDIRQLIQAMYTYCKRPTQENREVNKTHTNAEQPNEQKKRKKTTTTTTTAPVKTATVSTNQKLNKILIRNEMKRKDNQGESSTRRECRFLIDDFKWIFMFNTNQPKLNHKYKWSQCETVVLSVFNFEHPLIGIGICVQFVQCAYDQ